MQHGDSPIEDPEWHPHVPRLWERDNPSSAEPVGSLWHYRSFDSSVKAADQIWYARPCITVVCVLFGGLLQVIHVSDEASDPVCLIYGISQGSVLGPLEFIAYMFPIYHFAQRHGISIHQYPDDTQLYLAFDLDKQQGRAVDRHREQWGVKSSFDSDV